MALADCHAVLGRHRSTLRVKVGAVNPGGGDEDVVAGGGFGGFQLGPGAGLLDQVLPGRGPVKFPVQAGSGYSLLCAVGVDPPELGVEDHLSVVVQVLMISVKWARGPARGVVRPGGSQARGERRDDGGTGRQVRSEPSGCRRARSGGAGSPVPGRRGRRGAGARSSRTGSSSRLTRVTAAH